MNNWARCPAKVGYELQGAPRKTNSAAAYGSVIHHAIHSLERLVADGESVNEATETAVNTFIHYWHPLHIEAITDPVPEDGWIRGHGYSELRQRGILAIRKYADLMRFDDHELLALEYTFVVPVDGTWDDELNEPHHLVGIIDRLAVRHFRRVPVLMTDDYKTGKTKTYLRHDLQFTCYAFATTRPEFWVGYRDQAGFGPERGQALYERFRGLPRRGSWIDLKNFKNVDAGWRGETDYDRMRIAISQVAASIQADIFPLSISGENCMFCFVGDTRAWTSEGLRRLNEMAGTSPFLLVHAGAGGQWIQAPVRHFGRSPVMAVTLARGKDRKVIRATPDHRWFVRNRRDPSRTERRVVVTSDLKAGDQLHSLSHRPRLMKVQPSPFGIAAGIVFGDGCATQSRDCSTLDLWGDSVELVRFFVGCPQSAITRPERGRAGKGIGVRSLPRFFKDPPSFGESASYLYGWLAGYFAADGHITKTGQVTISSARRDDLEIAQTVATRLGIFTHEIHGYDRLGIDGKVSRLYKLGFALESLTLDFFLQDRHRQYYRSDVVANRIWTVVQVLRESGEQDVYCATVPGYGNFTIEGFINVGNCEFRGTCGSTGLPADDHGSPFEEAV